MRRRPYRRSGLRVCGFWGQYTGAAVSDMLGSRELKRFALPHEEELRVAGMEINEWKWIRSGRVCWSASGGSNRGLATTLNKVMAVREAFTASLLEDIDVG